MLPTKNRSAWIVQWRKDRRELTQLDLRPHVLPWRWSAAKVSDYMRCVYWNSALTTPYGALLKININEPLGISRTNKGSRLSYGDLTRLVAWRVKDLSFERVGSNKIMMEWTAYAGWNLDQTPIGESRRHRFEFDIVL